MTLAQPVPALLAGLAACAALVGCAASSSSSSDGRNNQVLTLERETGAVAGTLGRPGRYAGEFHWVHDLAIDSNGNLYAGEVDTGKRIQRFVRK